MKFIAYGDTHIHDFREFNYTLPTGWSNRIELALRSLRFMIDYARENNITTMFHLGDMYEYPKAVDTTVASLVAKELSRYEGNHYYITGNHDVIDKKQNYSVSSTFSKFFDKIIDVKNYQTVHSLGGTDYKWIGLPYFENYNEMLAWLDSIKSRENIFILGHFAVDGVRFSADYPVETICKQQKFKGFKLAIFGHVHLRQELDNNIVYPGSLLSHTFKDASGGKGFLVYDTETSTYEYIENPFSPRFHRIAVTSKKDFPKLTKEEIPVDYHRLLLRSEDLAVYSSELSSYTNVSTQVIPHKIDNTLGGVKVEELADDEELLPRYFKDVLGTSDDRLVKYGLGLVGLSR